MADIPQEVREAAAKVWARGFDLGSPTAISKGNCDNHPLVRLFHAVFLAGKRAGMKRAAEIAETAIADGISDDCCIDHAHDIAQAIRSEANAQSPASPSPDRRAGV